MATTKGCIVLLSKLASLDQRVRFDEYIADSWANTLRPIPDEVLVPAAEAAARAITNGQMVTVGLIEQHAQPFMRKIARDVRSARARGLVPDSWPENQPIPAHAREALRREFEQFNDYPDEIAVGSGRPANGGQIGRRP